MKREILEGHMFGEKTSPSSLGDNVLKQGGLGVKDLGCNRLPK